MTRVIVRPAGAERETLLVALLAAAIVCAAGITAVSRSQTVVPLQMESWQIDARDGLNAAEQGLGADLKAAASDIAMMRDAGGVPDPSVLAAEGIPPFTDDVAAARRGSHAWTVHRHGTAVAYLGITNNSQLAGSMLLLIDGSGSEIWINRSGTDVPDLEAAALAAAGWRKVVSSYDASVTREGK